MTKIPNFENSRLRTTAILKMVLSLYLSRESSDFDGIWCADSNFGSKNGHVLIYKKFMKFKWRTAAILKIVSTSYCPIDAIFRLYKTTSRTMPRDKNSNFRKFKMADDRHFENGFITISQLQIIRFQ